MKFYPLLIDSHFIFSCLFLKVQLFAVRYPLLYLFIISCFRLIFAFSLVWFVSDSSVIYCMANSDSWTDDYFVGPSASHQASDIPSQPSQPPAVNYESKPQLSSRPHELEGRALEYPSRTQGPVELDGRPTQNPSTSHVELPANYPNTSSVFTERDSVPSNINELGVATPIPSPTNTPQPLNINESQISFYSGGDSSNTSLDCEIGSTDVVVDRFNGDDYHNTQLDNDRSQYPNIGYLAPTPEPSNQYDYTERIIPRVGLTGELKLGFKHFKSDVQQVYLKYHSITKRKSFWTIYEKHKETYSSYQDFKVNWDPNTPFWKTIFKELKSDVREDLKSALGISNKGVTSEAYRLIRNNRPFNR